MANKSHQTWLAIINFVLLLIICLWPITIILGQRPNPRQKFLPPRFDPRLTTSTTSTTTTESSNIQLITGLPPYIPPPSPPTSPVSPPPAPVYPSPAPPPPPRRLGHAEHRPKVTEIWRSPLNLIWNCKLNRQPCDLKNGINFIPFETSDDKRNRFGSETFVANLVEASQIIDGRMEQKNPKLSFKASRLWTKNYFPARFRNACLFLSYSMLGNYRKQLYIMQRNAEDVCVYSAEHYGQQQQSYAISTGQSSPNNQRWIDAEIQLDLKYGDARFVLDFEYDLPATINYQSMGSVEIRNFSIAYGNCLRNDGNECDSLHDITQP